MATVRLEKVTKTFPVAQAGGIPAVAGVDLEIADGDLLVLLGPSGCGKSTTLRLIAGLERVCEGSILIAGEVVNDKPPRDRDVAMVLQSQALYPHLTIAQNLALGLKLRKVAPAEVRARVDSVVTSMGLTPLLQRYPSQLSVGERQRVALCRALARRPGVFLLDEPLASLDAPGRAQLRDELAQVHARLGTAMFYVTHDQDEAMSLGNRIAVMRSGRIQQVGTPREVYRRPRNLFVAGFVGSPPMNLLRGTLRANGSHLCFQEHNPSGSRTARPVSLPVGAVATRALADHVNGEVVLGLRPEALCLAGTGVGGGTGFPAEVIRVEPLGAECRVCLRTASGHLWARTQPGASESIRRGEEQFVHADSSKAHFFDPVTELAMLPPEAQAEAED